VDTVAVGAVLIAYNWPKTNADRYRRVQKFVEAFFPKIAEFQKPPRHVKWREINLSATLPGWTRFDAAQAWLDNQRSAAAAAEQGAGGQTVASSAAVARSGGTVERSAQRQADPALFQEFLRWRQTQGR
jgi:hypothetical protein